MQTTTYNAGTGVGVAIFYLIFLAIFVVPTIAGLWKVFEKAGKPGWAALIPIYINIVWLEVAGESLLWLLVGLVLIIPVLGWLAWVGVSIYLSMDMARSFGKDPGFGVGLALLPFIFYPILGFGPDRYLGPAGKQRQVGSGYPSYPPYAGGYPPSGYPPSGYPAAPGYPQGPAPGGYPQPGGYPPAPGSGYPSPPAPGGYPQPGGSGSPPTSGYPAPPPPPPPAPPPPAPPPSSPGSSGGQWPPPPTQGSGDQWPPPSKPATQGQWPPPPPPPTPPSGDR